MMYYSKLDLLLLEYYFKSIGKRVRVYNSVNGFSKSKDIVPTSLAMELKKLAQKGIAFPKDTIYLIHSSHIAGENTVLISDTLLHIYERLKEDKKKIIVCGNLNILTDYCQRFFKRIDDDNILNKLAQSLEVKELSIKELKIALKHGGYPVIEVLKTCNDFRYIKEKYMKTQLLEEIKSEIDFTLVGGWDKAKRFFNEILKPLYEKKPDIGLPNHILLKGKSGTGKTLLAKAVAKEFNLPLYRVDMGRIYNKYVGNSEENIRKLWEEIEMVSPAVILFDELEKMLSGFGSSNEVDAGTTARIFGYTLYQLQEHSTDSIIIATLNREDILPEEILRKGRWDEVFETTKIDILYVEDVIKAVLRRYKIKFSYKTIGKILSGFIDYCKNNKLTGADIDNLIRMAIYKLVAKNKEINLKNLLEVLGV